MENKNSFLGMFKKYIPASKNKNDDLKNKENTVIAVRNKIKHLEETLDNASTKKERKKIQREVKKLKNKLESGVDGAPGFTAPFGY